MSLSPCSSLSWKSKTRTHNECSSLASKVWTCASIHLWVRPIPQRTWTNRFDFSRSHLALSGFVKPSSCSTNGRQTSCQTSHTKSSRTNTFHSWLRLLHLNSPLWNRIAGIDWCMLRSYIDSLSNHTVVLLWLWESHRWARWSEHIEWKMLCHLNQWRLEMSCYSPQLPQLRFVRTSNLRFRLQPEDQRGPRTDQLCPICSISSTNFLHLHFGCKHSKNQLTDRTCNSRSAFGN